VLTHITSNNRTGNLDKFCPYAKIIHIDIDPSSVGKTVGVDVAIIGQVNDALNALIQALKDQKLVNIDAPKMGRYQYE
jgi:acetolactate synthase-1/2/3 large subunit